MQDALHVVSLWNRAGKPVDNTGVPDGPILTISRSDGGGGKIKLNGGHFPLKASLPDRSTSCMDAMPIPGITSVADLPRRSADWTWAEACVNARDGNEVIHASCAATSRAN